MTDSLSDRDIAIASNDECRVLLELRKTPQILEEIARWNGPELGLQSRLRRQYSDELVRAALSLCELRKKAEAKFSLAQMMWFDRKGLEQSTSELVARHKARRFGGQVTDLCCGNGSDAIAFASRGPVVAVDLNPAACLRTEWNAAAYGVAQQIEVLCNDALKVPITGLIHIDPDRRAGSEGKASRLEDYVPGPAELLELMSKNRGGAVKVGPASNFGGKFPDAEIELVSLHGECKEATVWFGELAGTAPFRATVLPDGATIAGHPLDAAVPLAPLRRNLFDPDPAVVRAGLVDLVAEQLNLNRLDSAEEYLTGDELIPSPFVRPFEVLAELPNNESELREWLRRSDFGQVEIKCRHIPVQAETLRRRLPLPGSTPGVVFVARIDGKSRMICARRVQPQNQ